MWDEDGYDNSHYIMEHIENKFPFIKVIAAAGSVSLKKNFYWGSLQKMKLSGLGKRHMELFSKWVPNLTIFGFSATALLCYATDWRLVLDYVPYYNGKFKTEE